MSRVGRFVDVEAQVDDGEDSEVSQDCEDMLERDIEDAFIDDEHDEDFGSTRARMIDGEADSTRQGFEQLMDAILLSASRRSGNDSSQWGAYIDNTHVFQLRQDDYPLWKIQCRQGVEETAVISILQTANDYHQVRSAFAMGTVRGSIYVETCMNTKTIELLMTTPGIVVGRYGVIRRRIKTGDYTKTLTTKDIDRDFSVGDWVRVRSGMYKGDVGIIDSIHGWGATMLLLPRLALDRSPSSVKKRKLSVVRPDPKLFVPGEVQYPNVRTQSIDHSTHRIGSLRFEHGLLSKEVGFATIDKRVHRISYGAFKLFEKSCHPRILKYPTLCPTEWHIQEGDRIIHLISRKYGTIRTAYRDRVEVELEDEGLKTAWWQHIQKLFFVGEAVSVMGGSNTGMDGWVVSCHDGVASIVSGSRGTSSEIQPEYKETEVPINMLKSGTWSSVDKEDKDHQHLSRTRKPHPWTGIQVIISRQGHARKGATGRVVDVCPPRPGEAKPIIKMQLARYNPYEPFREVVVEYDDVVVTRNLKPLHEADVGMLGADRGNEAENVPLGGKTPMPTEISSTPAWNPQHNTDNWDMLANQGSTSHPPPSRHILINPIFVGIKLNVIIEGHKNTGTVTVDFSNGTGCLRETTYNTSKRVPDDKVRPKHPSPTHDNGLLIIINGSHIGKYARRVYHRHRQGGTTLVKVAIVDVMEGLIDRDTGEVYEMETVDLCTVEESEEQVKLNKKPMEAMRHRLKKAPLS